MVLLMRSYWWSDMASRRTAAIWSTRGCFTCLLWKGNPSLPTATTSVDVDLLPVGVTAALGLFSFDLQYDSTGIVIQLPHWTLVLMTGICGAAPWIRQLKWRFTTRTLLIATTLVAVVLGLIVWAAHLVEQPTTS
jgi:hypothetical protein